MERKHRNPLLAAAATVVIFGSGAILGHQYTERESNSSQDETEATITVDNAPEVLSSPIDIEALTQETDPSNLIQRYFRVSQNFENIFVQETSIDGSNLGNLSKRTINEIETNVKTLVLEGAQLNNLISPNQQDQIQVSEQKDSLVINNIEYDFNDNFQLQIAASIVKTKLRIDNILLSGSDYDYKGDLDKDIKNLEWLRQANINVSVDTNSFALVPTEHLLTMSKILQKSNELGIPYPSQIRFSHYNRGDSGAAWYQGSNFEDPFRITITNVATSTAVVHEFAHYFSDLTAVNEDQNDNYFSQQSFDDMLLRLADGSDNNEQLTSFVTNQKYTQERKLREEYAESFLAYFYYGTDFRWRIVRSEPGSQEWKILISEYQFMQGVFKGEEFTHSGRPVEKLPKNEPLSVGNVVKITDTDFIHPGIFLRPEANLDKNLEYPVVWDEDTLKIIGGPQTIIDEKGTEVELWNVLKVYDDGYRLYETDDSGWISREWFSQILPSRDN